jgi:hypothetical protein
MKPSTLLSFVVTSLTLAGSGLGCTVEAANSDAAGEEEASAAEVARALVDTIPAPSPSAATHPHCGRYYFRGGTPIRYARGPDATRSMSTEVTTYGSVTVASNEADRLWIFASDKGSAIRYRELDASCNLGPWRFLGHYAKLTPTATLVSPQVLSVFMVGDDGNVYYRLINAVTGTPGSTGAILSEKTKRPLGAATMNGSTYLFMIDDWGRVDIGRLTFNPSTATFTHHGWSDYGLDAIDVNAHHVAGSNALLVAAVDPSAYLHVRQISGPTSLGGWLYDPAYAFVAGQPGLAGPDVYVRGLDGNIYEKVIGSTGRFVAPY